MGIVDFTNPRACEWFAGHVRRLAQMHVGAIKTDFGERIPTQNVAVHDGSDPHRMHNCYPLLYNRTVHAALLLANGEDVLFARSATAGGGQFPVHWGGDCNRPSRACAVACRWAFRASASGATTSAASRHRRSTSAGWPSGCCRHAAA